MNDFYQTPRFQLPDEWVVEDTICVKVTIPNDQQYLGQLIGLIDMLKWSRNFAPDETRTGAAIVSRTWQRALESSPIETEGCEMPEFRINPETCVLEVNCSDDPESPEWKQIITQVTDPREIEYPSPYPDAPPEGQTNQCLAAVNITEWVWITGYNWAQQLDDGGLFAEFIVLVMGVIGGFFTLLTDIIIDETVDFFTEIDPETILADWTAIDKPDFQNIIVCYLDENGAMPAENWGDFLTALHDLGATNQGWYLIHYIMVLMGWGGVNLLGRIGGLTEGDCVDCDQWVRYYRTTDSEWPQWVNGQAGTGYEIEGEYVGGSGWSISEYQSGLSTYTRMVVLRLEVAGMNLERIIVKSSGTTSTPSNAPLGFVIYDLQHSSYLANDLAPDDTVFDITLDETCSTNAVMIQIGIDQENSFAALAGSGFVYEIELRGTGTAPTGGV